MYDKRLCEIAEPLEVMLIGKGFEQGRISVGDNSINCTYTRNGHTLEYHIDVKYDDAAKRGPGRYLSFVTELSLKVDLDDGDVKKTIHHYDGKSNQDAVGVMAARTKEVEAAIAKAITGL